MAQSGGGGWPDAFPEAPSQMSHEGYGEIGR